MAKKSKNKVLKPAEVAVGDTVAFKKGRGQRAGKIIGITEAMVLEEGEKKPHPRRVAKLFAIGAVLTSMIFMGCSPLPKPGTPAGDAIVCAKTAGGAVLADAKTIISKASQKDWVGALAQVVKDVGPSILCEIDVLVELLKGNGDLAGAVGAMDGALLQQLPREDLRARLEAFRALHSSEAVATK